MKQFVILALFVVAATGAPVIDVTVPPSEVEAEVTTPGHIPVHVVVVDEPVSLVQESSEDKKVDSESKKVVSDTENAIPEVEKVVPETEKVIPEKKAIEPIAILHQDADVKPDGTFHNTWNSENGIKVQEEGIMKQVDDKTAIQIVKGEIAYTDREGKSFVLSYVADETGFHPTGDHLPTPPPIPEAIARGLEWIAAHPSVEKSEVEKTTEKPAENETVESITEHSE